MSKGPFTLLPQPPRAKGGVLDPFETEKWFTRIWLILGGLTGIGWAVVDKVGSRLDDIETRPHAMLQEVLGWKSLGDGTQDKHISNANGKVWQDHVEIIDGNPHGTDHAMLDAIMVLDPTSADITKDKHLSNAQGKVWQDHTQNTNIHHAPALASVDAVITVTGTAGVLYTGTEQAIINALIADVTALKNSLNDLKAKLRTPGTLTP
jgi:hypothetical protein